MLNTQFLKIKTKNILFLILKISLFQGVISNYFGFHQINYLCDILLIFLLVGRMHKIDFRKIFYKKIEYIPIIMFTGIVLWGWIFNSVPILQAIWGTRNYIRFFLYFIFCCKFLNQKDANKMEDFFIKIFPIHIGLIMYQYIVEGLEQDFLSGIFGKQGGGNGGLMIYLLIVLCIIIARFEYKKISLFSFIGYLFFIFLNAALSELKFIFIVTILFMGFYFFVCKRKLKGVILILFFTILLFIGIRAFYHFFPFWKDYLTFENVLRMIKDQQSYASQDDVGRTAVFSKLAPIINQWGGKIALWIGIGLGNADYSTAVSALNSLFFKVYGDIHYTWLSLGYLFVETGYLGVIAYTSFYIILELSSIFRYKKIPNYRNFLGMFFPIVCLILLVYNSTLRSNFAYMIFSALSWNLYKKSPR